MKEKKAIKKLQMIKSTLIWYNCLYFRCILCTLMKEKELLVKYVWIKDFRKKHYLYMQKNKILKSTNELFLILFEVCKFIMKPWFMCVRNHLKCQAKINQTDLSFHFLLQVLEPGEVVYTFNPSTPEVEADIRGSRSYLAS